MLDEGVPDPTPSCSPSKTKAVASKLKVKRLLYNQRRLLYKWRSQAISESRNVDLIEDSTLRMPRTPFSGDFCKPERRRHRGFDGSDAQAAILF